MAVSSTAIPKPTNWEDFEKKMLVLAQYELKDRKTQRHGRSGQSQAGVDIYGDRDGKPEAPFGIQCKQKLGKGVTEKELRAEAKNALKFKPHPPVEFILATTAPRDQAIQAVARTVTQELVDAGVKMHVAVWGWEDIEERVSQHAEALRAFDPSYTPYVDALATTVAEQVVQRVTRVIEERVVVRQPAPESATKLSRDPAAQDTPLHGQITALVDLIDAGYPTVAFKRLEGLREKHWATATESERYRVFVALASAELKNNKYAAAGRLLIQAYEECPEHPRARQNLAKGHLLVDNAARARELAIGLMQKDPINSDAANTLIQSRLKAGLDEAPLADIPEALHESEDVMAAHVHYLRAKDDPEWKTLVERAIALHPEAPRIKIASAEAVLDTFAQNRRAIMGGGVTTEDERLQLQKAARTLITAAIDAVDNQYTVAVSLAVNAALAARFIDDIGTGSRILDAAVAQYPDDEVVRTHRGIIAFIENDFDTVLKMIPADAADAEGRSLRAVALIDSGRIDEGLASIASIDSATVPDHLKFGLLAARCRAYIARKEPDRAIQAAREAIAQSPRDLALRSLLIHTLMFTSNEVAEVELDEALAAVEPTTDFSYRLFLAFEADRLERHDAVVALLDGHVDLQRDSEALQLLIVSVMAQRSWVRARAIIDAIAPDVAALKWYQRTRTALAINAGQPNAPKLLDDYLAKWPHDASMVFARLAAWVKAGNTSKVEESCAALAFDELTGSPSTRIRIAAIAARHGHANRALPYAYATLMDHWDDHTAHSAYHGVFLLNDELSSAIGQADTVGDNTVVVVVSDDGEHRYRFEDRAQGAFISERIAKDSDLGKLLVGLRIGDVVQLQTLSEKTKSIAVREILPTYIDAFQRSIQQFNQRFPRAKGLWKVAMDFESEDPLQEMRLLTRRRAESNQALLDQYKSNPGLPFAFVARALGADPIEAWQGLASARMSFYVCRGNHVERDSVLTTLRKRARTGCVVDAITLSVVRRLGIDGAVRQVCGALHAPQSVFDLLGSRALEATGNVGKKMSFVSWQDNRLVMQEYPPELLEELAGEAVRERDWASQNVRVIAAIPHTDLDVETRTIVSAMGELVSEPAIAADGGGMLLLSDDMGLRLWAQEAFTLSAAWLQPVLMLARHEGHLSATEYYEAINTLVFSGHTFTSLDADAIMHQTRKDQFFLTPKVAQLIGVIGGPSADLNSNCKVASKFINGVLEEADDFQKGMCIMSKVLEAMTDGHFTEHRQIVATIASELTATWWITEHLLAWLLGHSIGTQHFDVAMSDYKRFVKRPAPRMPLRVAIRFALRGVPGVQRN